MPSNDQNAADFSVARGKIIAAASDCAKPLPHSWYFKRAWDKGVDAKAIGLMRVCPYYEDELREPYWLAGYDGLAFAPPMIVKQIEPNTPVPARYSEAQAVSS